MTRSTEAVPKSPETIHERRARTGGWMLLGVTGLLALLALMRAAG